MIGKPTHLHRRGTWAECGVQSHDPAGLTLLVKKVSCLRCRRTVRWKKARIQGAIYLTAKKEPDLCPGGPFHHCNCREPYCHLAGRRLRILAVLAVLLVSGCTHKLPSDAEGYALYGPHQWTDSIKP